MKQLYLGDCLETMDSLIGENVKVDMILTDLPYGTTCCSWDSRIPLDKLWLRYNKIIKPNGAILLFAKQPFTTDLINSNRKNYRYNWTWVKNLANGFLNANVKPLQSTEDICVFYNKKPVYNPQMQSGFERKVIKANHKRKCEPPEMYGKAVRVRDYDSNKRFPTDVLHFPKDKTANRYHPTQKPVPLLEYLIKTYTNAGDTVLDCCMGSGSTGVACANADRQFIGIDDNSIYYRVAKERIANAQAQLKLQFVEQPNNWYKVINGIDL